MAEYLKRRGLNYIIMLKLFRNFWENILERMINARYTSRWIIFSLDLLLSTASIVLSFILTINLSPLLVTLLPPFKILLFVNTILYAVFYLTFKTHSGIVRYSSNQDVWRLLASSFTANFILLVLGLVFRYGFIPELSLLIWNFTFSFVGLITFARVKRRWRSRPAIWQRWSKAAETRGRDQQGLAGATGSRCLRQGAA